ncbi:hypothetical protein [Brucella pseudogrignonensis]|uniref:hypothetical protein n=1 Tax=Brucella pseudogrignonensis TaxID=419475 RepID=UPI003ECCA3E9
MQAASHTVQEPIKVPANLAPFINTLGFDKGIEFLLRFGGATMYLPKKPQSSGRSMASSLLTAEEIIALSKALDLDYLRIPVAKKFIATYLRSQNVSVSEIARKLHMTDVTVRGYLKAADQQLSLL